MILIAGSLTLPDGALRDVRPAMEAQIIATRQDRGCLDYDCAIDVLDPNRLLIHERWEDQDSLTAHLAQPHVLNFTRALAAAGARDVSLQAYDTDGGRPLIGD